MLSKEVDNYIHDFPKEVQEKLELLRATILEIAPNAKEVISYKMPTYKLSQNLVHFAGYEKHIGFYPTPSAIEKFKHEFGNYKFSKGAVQFPLIEDLPIDLIKRMVAFRVSELKQFEKK
jgi:uncharacterized protein YdhG (YjbR/CyaY superfamily)